MPAASPGLVRRHVAQHRVVQPRERDALAEAGDATPPAVIGQPSRPNATSAADRRHSRSPGWPCRSPAARPQAHQRCAGQRSDEQADAVRHDRQAGMQWVGASPLLLVQAEQQVERGGEEEQRGRPARRGGSWGSRTGRGRPAACRRARRAGPRSAGSRRSGTAPRPARRTPRPASPDRGLPTAAPPGRPAPATAAPRRPRSSRTRCDAAGLRHHQPARRAGRPGRSAA